MNAEQARFISDNYSVSEFELDRIITTAAKLGYYYAKCTTPLKAINIETLTASGFKVERYGSGDGIYYLICWENSV